MNAEQYEKDREATYEAIGKKDFRKDVLTLGGIGLYLLVFAGLVIWGIWYLINNYKEMMGIQGY